MPPVPPSAMPPEAAATLAAVVRLARPTSGIGVRDVVAESGIPLASTHRWLVWLRERGLVTWDIGRAMTIHPTVEVVAVAS